jgi:uncharacterized tellurite resistance protein B-like protein
VVHAIQAFFEKHIRRGPETTARGYDPLHVATAALLIEMMRMDGKASEVERQRVVGMLERKFGLAPENISELLKLAEKQAQDATDYYRFTALIKNHFDAAERERLVENLWSVAYADGKLNRFEEHLVRKIADLLHVSHESFIAAKLRAQKAK